MPIVFNVQFSRIFFVVLCVLHVGALIAVVLSQCAVWIACVLFGLIGIHFAWCWYRHFGRYPRRIVACAFSRSQLRVRCHNEWETAVRLAQRVLVTRVLMILRFHALDYQKQYTLVLFRGSCTVYRALYVWLRWR